jgi:hypothetical protein
MRQGILYLLSTIFSIILVSSCSSNHTTFIKFNNEKWQHGNEALRFSMSQSIINDNLLINKSREEVVLLLGDPDDSTSQKNTFKWNLDQKLSDNSTWRS